VQIWANFLRQSLPSAAKRFLTSAQMKTGQPDR